MLLDLAKAEVVFRKVKQVREEYRRYTLAPDLNRISVEDLLATIQQMYSVRLERYSVPFEAHYTRGMLLRYAARSVIYVRHSLDGDLKRFTAVKETCHVVLDEKEDWSVKGVETITALQNDLFLNGESEMAKQTTQSEMFAEIAAIELMYPYECRKKDLESGSLNVTKIAVQHGMPESMVERALSKNFRHIADFLWPKVGLPDFLKES